MSERHGIVWWSELMTRDVGVARAYYSAVCGWEWSEMPMGDETYHMANAQGRPAAGMVDMSGMPWMDEAPPHWFTYLAVDDVDASVAETEAHGGRVLRAAFDVPGIGRIAIVQDPSGAAVGLMTVSEPAA